MYIGVSIKLNITIKSYHHEFRSLVDNLSKDGRITLPGNESVSSVLDIIGISKQKQTGLVLFINGRMALMDTKLSEGDTLVFFSPIAGG